MSWVSLTSVNCYTLIHIIGTYSIVSAVHRKSLVFMELINFIAQRNILH